jgi:hypothetical protein
MHDQYTTATFINNIGLCMTGLMGLLLILLPRRLAVFPVLFLVCYMSLGQRIIVAGLDFTMIRVLVIFGWLRLILRGELGGLHFTKLDKAVLWWTCSSVLMYWLLRQNTGAFIYRLGLAYNALGSYFLFRFLLRSRKDVDQLVGMFSLCVVPLALLIAGEKLTGRNAFAMFGGVPEITAVRDGVLRCQGPFAHPILAGTFAATQMPLFVPLWWRRGFERVRALLGLAACTAIVIAAGSSGPMFAYGFAVVGLALWPYRERMRHLRWSIAISLTGLHLVMKAPVWFLINRVTVFSSSTGYHRAILIDSAIKHFDEWWLLGTKSTAHWGFGLSDITNQYIRYGVDGGLLTLVFFVSIISRAFGAVGKGVRELACAPLAEGLQVWALGAALLTHVVSYFSVSYFDQNGITWMLLLAMISLISELSLCTKRRGFASADVMAGLECTRT